MTRQYRIVALPGEGIGLEVVEAALILLHAVATRYNFHVQVEYGWIGESARQHFGIPLPPETIQLCQSSDGILFGSVTQGGLLELRRQFDLFINLRPVRPSPQLIHLSPIQPDRLQSVDMLFVRELVSGIYFGAAGRGRDGQGDYGYHTMRYYDHEIRRIARVALHYAQQRRRHLTVAHKENALPQIPWIRWVQAEAEAFPTVTVQPMLVDNLAMQLVMHPQRFDVILASNLFGDILSDLGGAIAGSIGLLGSASLNAQGFGMYEAIHGTAPDIAGKGIANPLGTLAAVVMMLRQWGEQEAAQCLENLQESLLAQGYRTADLMSQSHDILVTTSELVDRFLDALETGKS